MTLNSLLAQDQLGRDLAIVLGQRHKVKDLQLAPGETSEGAPAWVVRGVCRRPRLITCKRVSHNLIQWQSAPLGSCQGTRGLAQMTLGNLLPAAKALAVCWK